MKTINLLSVFSICSLLIFSANGMEEEEKKDDPLEKSVFVKQQNPGLLYRAYSAATGKSHTNQIFDDYVGKDGLSKYPEYQLRLSNLTKSAINDQLEAIHNLNNLLPKNATIEQILANQKKKNPYIKQLNKILKMADKNKSEITDQSKKMIINRLTKEMGEERKYIASALTFSFTRYKKLALLRQKINEEMHNPALIVKFPKYNMPYFIEKLQQTLTPEFVHEVLGEDDETLQ